MSLYRSFRRFAILITLGAFTTAGCFVVDDSDDDDDEEGDAGEGGTGGTGGSGGSTSGAVMKFCNGLAREGMDITLTVEFAGVTASALSGTCTPAVPNACISIPTGTDPTVELREGTEVILSGSFPTLTVAAGDELLVLAALDDASLPSLFADTFELFYGPGYTCRDTDPATEVPPMASRSFDLPAQWNLRNLAEPSLLGETKGPLSARWLGR